MDVVKNLTIIFDPSCYSKADDIDDDRHRLDAIKEIQSRFRDVKCLNKATGQKIDLSESLESTKVMFFSALKNQILVTNEKYSKMREAKANSNLHIRDENNVTERRAFKIFEGESVDEFEEDDTFISTQSMPRTQSKQKNEFDKLGGSKFKVYTCDVLFWVATLDMFDLFPAFQWLAKLAVLLPFQTAEVERAFSRMNLIKRELRNRLLAPHLNALMRIALDVTINKNDFDEQFEMTMFKALQYWLASPTRRRNQILSDRQQAASYMINCWRTGQPVRFSDSESDSQLQPQEQEEVFASHDRTSTA
jgi:hypothetical protein